LVGHAVPAMWRSGGLILVRCGAMPGALVADQVYDSDPLSATAQLCLKISRAIASQYDR
jgi:hypothetical protein